MSSFTEKQEKVLALIPKFTAPLSFVGSACILFEIIRDRQKWKKPYHRILFSMCFMDLFTSVCHALSTTPIPRGSPHVYNPRGTIQTCSAQGFFLQAMISSPIYSFMLSLHFLLLVKYGVTARHMSRRIEPLMQGFTLLFAFGTSFVSLGLGQYNDSNLWCWINASPKGCKQSFKYGDQGDCERGDNAELFRWAFFFAPLWAAILGTMFTMGLLYQYVRQTEVKAARWNFDNPQNNEDHGSAGRSSSNRPTMIKHSSLSGIATSAGKSIGRILTNLSHPRKKPLTTLTTEDVLAGLDEAEAEAEANERRKEKRHSRKSRMVLNQALRYVAAFYLTWIAGTANRLLQLFSKDHHQVFWLMTLHAALTPMQGFFNFLVFQYPKFEQWQRKRKQVRANNTQSTKPTTANTGTEIPQIQEEEEDGEHSIQEDGRSHEDADDKDQSRGAVVPESVAGRDDQEVGSASESEQDYLELSRELAL